MSDISRSKYRLIIKACQCIAPVNNDEEVGLHVSTADIQTVILSNSITRELAETYGDWGDGPPKDVRWGSCVMGCAGKYEVTTDQ